MSSFRFDGGSLLNNIVEKQAKMKASLGLYADSSSKKLENYAKNNKPWKDRTHDARNRLNSEWQWRGDTIVISLAHGVDYGLYLEKGTPAHVITGNPWLYWQGASHPVRQVNHPGTKPYPIIMPAIDKCGPQIMAGLNILLSR